ncbi:hypothetical protein [Photobacterium leiognathi]|nr:hypothetical protein [Photobacterium leiognathi]
MKETQLNHFISRNQIISEKKRNAAMVVGNEDPRFVSELSGLQEEFTNNCMEINILNEEIPKLKSDIYNAKYEPNEAFQLLVDSFDFSNNFDNLDSVAGRHTFVTTTKNWLQTQPSIISEFSKYRINILDVCDIALK